jgi:hypothetical protein
VNYFGIIKGSNNLENTIDGSDMGQESVPEACACRGTCREAGDIDTGKKSWDARYRLVGLAKPFEAWIRNRDASFLQIESVLKFSRHSEEDAG